MSRSHPRTTTRLNIEQPHAKSASSSLLHVRTPDPPLHAHAAAVAAATAATCCLCSVCLTLE